MFGLLATKLHQLRGNALTDPKPLTKEALMAATVTMDMFMRPGQPRAFRSTVEVRSYEMPDEESARDTLALATKAGYAASLDSEDVRDGVVLPTTVWWIHVIVPPRS